jgi:simple sugar transport system ATP-binding protein
LSKISKCFGSFEALSSVTLEVETGTIHALVGENGAGKTTLMRILYGALRADTGQIEIHGRPVQYSNPSEAIRAGVGMVSQHYAIIGELTCLQNLMLGAEGGAVIADRLSKDRASELADQMGFVFDWDAEASTLTPASAQKLEILKLLWREARIMILDEPTAMLSPADGDALYSSLRKLADAGATVIVVTHRLPEVLEFADSVTVLRAGKVVGASPVRETSGSELASLIVGGDLPVHTVTPPRAGRSLLSLRGVSVRGDRGQMALKGISLEVRQGEVVGVAGVDGSGQRELFHVITGRAKADSGEILWQGNSVGPGVRKRVDLGVRTIPEDRISEAVIENWSLTDNAALGLQWRTPFSAGGRMEPRTRRAEAEKFASRFGTKASSFDQPIGSLSGGNQQRFVAGRALGSDGKLILAFQPTRGLDLKSKREVFEGIRTAARGGAGALVVSFDLDELLEECDRIVVLCNGLLSEPQGGDEKDRAEIGRLMVGA